MGPERLPQLPKAATLHILLVEIHTHTLHCIKTPEQYVLDTCTEGMDIKGAKYKQQPQLSKSAKTDALTTSICLHCVEPSVILCSHVHMVQ